MISKTAILSSGAGLSIFAISNEIYVINDETIVMIATFSVFWALFKYGGPMYTEWAQGQISKLKGILNAAKEDHKSAVRKRLDNVKQLSSVVDVTKQLFEVSKVCHRSQHLTNSSTYFLTYPRKLLVSRPKLSNWNRRLPWLQKRKACLTPGCVTKVRSSSDNRRSSQRASLAK